MGNSNLEVKKLRTEYLENPLGIDVRKPGLSWQIESQRRNVIQRAYQIQVAESIDQLERAGELLWDSGRIETDQLNNISYSGTECRSRKRYYWHVKAWDQTGVESGWSEPAWWEMGLLEESEWTADWIEPAWEEDPKAFKACPYLRRSFSLDAPVKSARLYISAHGLYEAWLNGERVGDQVFTPGYTPYDKMLQYQVYDVTPMLRQGENVIGAILGDGWYRGKVYGTDNRNVYGERLGLLAVLIAETAGGSQVLVGTDSGWKAATGPILKSDLKDGEVYDARLEMPGWSDAGFNDGSWKDVRVIQHSKNHLVASMGVPVRRKETFQPILIETPNGEMVLDFGQNLAGVVHFKVKGPEGTTIRLRHGETLDQDGNFTIAHLNPFAKPDPDNKPFQEVRYTLKGEGVEEYEPHFTVHGFRYVVVDGYPGELNPEDFYSVAIYSDLPPTGTFECSDALISRLHKNVEWSMKSNFLDLPTDCPQRERAGWTGDAQIFTPSASFLMDTRAFFRKWLKELAVEQFSSGMVGNFVPDPYRLSGGVAASLLLKTYGSAGWGDAATIMPWALYQVYGDRQILESQYASMRAWVEYMRERAGSKNWTKNINPGYIFDAQRRAHQHLIWDTNYHWGEWLEPGEGGMAKLAADALKRLFFGSPVVASAYFAHSTRILARAAEVLGKTEDAKKYGALAEQIKTAYIAEFIGKDGRIKPDRQASYVRVLAFDLAPEELKPVIVDHLLRLIHANQNHIGTGFLSTVFLCEVLVENGHLDVAYDLLNQKSIPSWLYAVTKGATTIWETWEGIDESGKPNMSLNHYSPGAVINFLHRKVAGIEAAAPGYKRINIHPMPGGGLTSARATYESVNGLILSEWIQEEDHMRVNVLVPANTTAAIVLPNSQLEQVTENQSPLRAVEGIHKLSQDSDSTVLEVGSGEYVFEYPIV